VNSPAALRAAERIVNQQGLKLTEPECEQQIDLIASIIAEETGADRQELISFVRATRMALAGRQRTPEEEALSEHARSILARLNP